MYAAPSAHSTPAMKDLPARPSHASTQMDFFTVLETPRGVWRNTSEEPRCVFVATRPNLARSSAVCASAQSMRSPVSRWCRTPRRATARRRCGADDALVSGDRGGITPAAQPVECETHSRTVPQQGIALVASGDIGIAAHSSDPAPRGIDVSYATDERELVELAVQESRTLTLVVANRGLPAARAQAAIQRRRSAAHKPSLPALIVPADANGRWDPNSEVNPRATGKLLFFARRGDPRARPTISICGAPALPDGSARSGRRACSTDPTDCPTHQPRGPVHPQPRCAQPRHAGLDRTAVRPETSRSCICAARRCGGANRVRSRHTVRVQDAGSSRRSLRAPIFSTTRPARGA